MKEYKLIVKGTVQGVGFRYFTLNQAIKYNIKGYTKNLSNGDVEIIAQYNEQEKFNTFLDEIKKGPLFSNVTRIIQTPVIDDQCLYKSFKIKY